MTWLRLTGLGLFLAIVLSVGLDGELIRNEGLRARLAAEALATGDWLVPRLYGEPHLTKPPGMTALIAACSVPFGRVTPVSARLPSVFAAVAMAALFGWTIGRSCGRNAGLAAAALLPCCPFWLERVPSAEIDLVQLAWVGGSLLCLLHAVELEEGGGAVSLRWGWWLAALLCVAGGLVTKWTAPAFFYLTALPWLWWRGRLGLLLRPAHLVGMALAAAVVGVWLLRVVASGRVGAAGNGGSRGAVAAVAGTSPAAVSVGRAGDISGSRSSPVACRGRPLPCPPVSPPENADRRRPWQLCGGGC
ncbi:MAG: glycosyltransferase family 39 protein [Gemmataceae bacterium]